QIDLATRLKTSGALCRSVWKNAPVTVTLTPADTGGSGIKTTTYELDNGTTQTGTSIAVAGQGVHTIKYRSTDNAGNVQTDQTARSEERRAGKTTTDHAPP